MRKLWPYIGIALAVAVGIALAPFLWWILGLAALFAILIVICTAALLLLKAVDARLSGVQEKGRVAADGFWAAFNAPFVSIAGRLPKWAFGPLGLIVAITAGLVIFAVVSIGTALIMNAVRGGA